MTYHATVQRGERFWLVYVAELDRWTQARHDGEIELMARDLVATMLEIPADSFEMEITHAQLAG